MAPASFLLSTLPLAAVLAWLGWTVRSLQLRQRDHADLLAHGEPAVGVVRSLEPGFPRRMVYELGLEVSAPGRAPYTTKSRQLIDEHRVGSVQPGMSVHLRVDPKDQARLVVTDSPGQSADGLLFSPKRKSRFFALMYVVLTFGALVGILLPSTMVDWESLSPPPEGGFCEAATRCCRALPSKPLFELPDVWAFKPLDRCDVKQDDERLCRTSYRLYKNEAKAAGLTCN